MIASCFIHLSAEDLEDTRELVHHAISPMPVSHHSADRWITTPNE